MKLISWNVNGVRAVQKKGLIEFIERENPEILCLQETKAHKEQLTDDLLRPLGYHSYWSSATRKGYSGVVTYCREKCPEVAFGIGREAYDTEGRFLVTEHPDFTLYNVYFPNGSSSEERHLFKQSFLREFNDHLRKRISQGREVIVVGDYNVAHREIDVFDPIGLSRVSGFLPEERAWFDEFLKLGFVDVYRHFHPDRAGKYTWWSYREMARPANRGWRLDYICVTQGFLPRVRRAEILDGQQGSDHCPVSIEWS